MIAARGRRGGGSDQARHPPAPHHDAQGVRKCDHGRALRSAARPMRCCICWRSPRRPNVKLDAGRFHSHRPAGSGAGGPASQRPVLDVRAGRDRRHSAADEDAADAGLLHGDCLTVTGARLARESPRSRPIPLGRRSSGRWRIRSRRTAISWCCTATSRRRGGGKNHREGGPRFTGRARVFDSEEESLAGILGGKVRAGRRGGDPLRGPERRPRHARNAQPDRRNHGQGARQRGRADHRRAFLRRQPWVSSSDTSRRRRRSAARWLWCRPATRSRSMPRAARNHLELSARRN